MMAWPCSKTSLNCTLLRGNREQKNYFGYFSILSIQILLNFDMLSTGWFSTCSIPLCCCVVDCHFGHFAPSLLFLHKSLIQFNYFFARKQTGTWVLCTQLDQPEERVYFLYIFFVLGWEVLAWSITCFLFCRIPFGLMSPPNVTLSIPSILLQHPNI